MSTAPGRPGTRLAIAGSAVHAGYELAAGVGMPLASVLGPGPATAAWTVATAAGWRSAGHRALPVANGVALAAVLAHYAGWPRRPGPLGLPWLVECEGLRGELMPAYNVVLLATAAGAALGLARESGGRRRAGLGPLVAVPALVALQHREHARLVAIAAARPRWWNRRLR